MGSTGQIQQPTWSQLLGSNNWEGLLEPLDSDLRRLILRCGDFCQATYDAFNNDKNSRFCGSSRYGKTDFFHKVALPSASHYQVSSFLYATACVSESEAFLLHSQSRECWDRESNWIGYIAVTTDDVSRALGRREIYVAWRGTTRNYEWIDVMGAKLQSAAPLFCSGKCREDQEHDNNKVPKVMRGWLTIYTSDDPKSPFTKQSARTQLHNKIRELIDQYKEENLSIILTGHSLGASLSVLAGFDLAENGISGTNIPMAAFVFGCPQVGNGAFNQRLNQFPHMKVLHIKNKIDIIPHYPGHLLGFVNSGIKFKVDTRKSPFLKDSKNPSDWHNLQAMLHVVAGWNGAQGEFELKVKRSLALVNKSCDFLKEECLVPGSWWVEKNKGLVMDENGEWVLTSPADEDQPVPEY